MENVRGRMLMKCLKKVLVAIVAAAMLMANFPLYADAITDIKGYWAEEEISKLREEGLVSGYSDGSFQPDREITRAEFVVALNRMMGFTGEAPINFKDVKADDWFVKALAVAMHHGYIKGYADGSFRPNAKVSRFEVAVMIARANRLFDRVKADDTDLRFFSDGERIPNWAKAALSVVVKSGIMKGDLEKFFKGEKKMTRGEAVVSLSRAREVKQAYEAREQNTTETLKDQLFTDKVDENKIVNKDNKNDIKKDTKKDKKEEAGGAGDGLATGGGASIGGGIDSGGSTGGAGGDTGGGTSGGGDAHSLISGSEQTVPGEEGEKNSDDMADEGASSEAEKSEDSTGSTEHSSSGVGQSQAGDSSSETDQSSGDGEASDGGADGDITSEGQVSEGTQLPGGQTSTDGSAEGAVADSTSNQGGGTSEGDIDSFIASVTNDGYGADNIGKFTKGGEERAVLWTKGITIPAIHESGTEGDFKRSVDSGQETYEMPYQKGLGWYDVDKKQDQAEVLCAAAVSTNMLYWWADQNKSHLNRYLTASPQNGLVQASVVSQDVRMHFKTNGEQSDSDDSNLFRMWTGYYGTTNGVWADTTIDFFINGYEQRLDGQTNHGRAYVTDPKGGYFRNVFKSNILTQRVYINKTPSALQDISRVVKEGLKEGKVLAVSYLLASSANAHIVTIWGAEYNALGELKALYITDSDDRVGRMTRSLVKMDAENNIRISNDTRLDQGPRVMDIYSLSLGAEHWENYFRTTGGN